MSNKPSESEKPILRSTKIAGALLMFCIGLAPMGFAACFKPAHWLDSAFIPFWGVILVSTAYALVTKDERRASIVIRVMWAVGLMNLAGCADILCGIGRATNG
ncbi:hypothetical protein KP004_03680 [Geomonas oryzisoli]|uniref:Uncharacterized protein n=1 Tax=Geomonas oryzisoli TaxID=2847992 RepID=A0ABX8J8E2_9BACT|nr:hypothetical protein [Geomonas oryzisoli]QWV94296.1 hypothetical protein KP004_03680 [Geomonas oryzisoli]